MAKNFILIFINILAIAILFWCVIFASEVQILNPYLLVQETWGENHQIINLLYNSFHSWSFDPLLSQLLLHYQTPAIIIPYSLFFFLLGWFLLLRKQLEITGTFLQANLKSLFITFGILATLGVIFQLDLVLLTSLTWLPFFILATQNFLEKKFTSLIYLIPASLLLILSSNQLSILYLIIILSCILLQEQKKTTSLTRVSYQKLVFFFILLCSCSYILFFPKTTFFDYLVNQRVLTKDFLPVLPQPLFGPSSPIKFLELDNITNQLAGVAPCLLIISISFLWIFKKNLTVWLVIFLNTLILLDLNTSYQFKHILPLEALSRLIPHWSFFALPIFLTALSISAVIYVLITNKKSVLILPFLSLLVGSHQLFNQTEPNKLQNIRSLNELIREADLKHLNSPSAQIILANQSENFHKLFKLQKKHFRPIKKLHPIITTSNNLEDTKLLADKDPTSHWGTKLTKQLGDEWVKLTFSKPVAIEGISLDSGYRHTDFPRGLRISSSADCSQNLTASQTFFMKNPWNGSIAFTKLGYPYYTHESMVKVFFPRQTVACLKIEQIGENQNFDWAINEIKYLK